MREKLQLLDPVNIGLNGTKLIEASAGTGKTYAITGLYIRLLLERQLSVDAILVVTFTEAATKELRERIRQRLHDALRVYEKKAVSDPFLQALYEKHLKAGMNIKQCRERLSLALHSIDLASISTIHGFCSRVLQDSAFESGLLFDLTLNDNDSELLGQIIDDYWRNNIGRWSDPFVQYLFGKKIDADTLVGMVQAVVKVARGVGFAGIDFPSRMKPALFNAPMDDLAATWNGCRHEIVELLKSPALSKAKSGRYHPDNVRQWVTALDNYFLGVDDAVLPVVAFEKLSSSALLEGTQPSKVGLTPVHKFFVLAEQLISQLKEAVNGLYSELIEESLRKLPELKKSAATFSFDDLLLWVRDGLRDEGLGGALAEKIRRQYQALLIDEFQDTDAVQYEIFRIVYGNRETPMFLIGDPKQAIYRFRGADVYAYLKAVKGAGPHLYGMATNWRSEPAFVHALNVVFGCTADHAPFLIPEIAYQRVQPSKVPGPILSIEGDESKAISFLTFPDQQKKGRAKQFIANNLARQITRLIGLGNNGKASFIYPVDGSSQSHGRKRRQKLQAGDMAVLVRNHKDAELIHGALAEQGVRSVIQSRLDVFKSLEARELQIVLMALLRPTDPMALKSALATSLYGWSSDALIDLNSNEELWEQVSERFINYLRVWQAKGFAAMIFALLGRELTVSNLAKFHNGERRITNLRHIIEILQQVALSECLSPAALVEWFQKQRHASELSDDRQLRLESDEALVKIVTIHKSKGLEYPLVFCPFLWDSPYLGPKENWVAWHDEDGSERIDMGTNFFEERHNLRTHENMAEEVRVLYVALTRARNRCVIYWGNVMAGRAPVSSKSAFFRLLSSFAAPESISVAGAVKDSGFMTPVEQMAAFAPDSISCAPCEPLINNEDLACSTTPALLPVCRELRSVPANWSVLSFSSLLRQEKGFEKEVSNNVVEEPDHDGLFASTATDVILPSNKDSASIIFQFPRGANAGSCLHDIFEKLDFTAIQNEQSAKIVADTLAMYGIDKEWQDSLLAGLDSIVQTCLDEEQKDLRLASITCGQRINEMEFYYPLPGGSGAEFLSLFHGNINGLRHKRGESAGMPGGPLGYMKGFIDLIFEWQGRYYIVDYKSNYLGDHYEDYHKSRLLTEMKEAGYDMQYNIYMLALHRYLRKRVPNYDYETHMGGIYYLFIRGMSPALGADYGVFKERPDGHIIEIMDKILYSSKHSAFLGQGEQHG